MPPKTGLTLPEHVQRVILAALLHDLPALARPIANPSAGLARVLALAQPASPAERELVRQAEACALAGGAPGAGPLRSIFARVSLNGHEPPQAWHALAPLGAADELGAALQPIPEPAAHAREPYLSAMFEALDTLGAQVDLANFEHAYPQLLAWLGRFGRCLPAHRDDLPLADHARLAGAVAACLAQLPAGAAQPLCLVGAQLTGGRGYCLGAAQPGGGLGRLQARAQYLARLGHALGHELAERMGVPHGNQLWQLNGRMILLAPNTPALTAALNAFEHELGGWLHTAFAGELALALARVPLALAELGPGFSAHYEALSQQLGAAAQRAGHTVLAGPGGWHEDAFVFRQHSFAAHPPCAGCGRLPGAEAGGLCPHCARDERLSQQLANSQAIAYYREAGPGATELLPGRAFLPLAAGDMPPGEPYLVVRLNRPAPAELAALPASFEYSASHSLPGAAGPGQALLGFLQLALDDDDALLARGLRGNAAGCDTAAHLGALGRELALLRAGGLQRLLAQPGYRGFAAIELGGDLLLIGPWEHAAPLALDMRAQTEHFTGHNPSVTCSAGLALAKPHASLARAAERADALLGQAQARPWPGSAGQPAYGGQLALLGDLIRWADAPLVFNEVDRLRRHGQFISATLLRDLIEYGRLQQLWHSQQRSEGLRYKALFVYSLARALRRGDSELYRWADELIRSLHSPADSLPLRYMGVIATYLLLIRGAG